MKKIVIGIILFILGAFVIPVMIFLSIYLNMPASTQFKVPGSAMVTIDEPGRYYLWNDYNTVFEGKSYNVSREIPDGVDIKITNADSGEPFNFVSDHSTSSSSGESSKNSIGYIEAEGPTNISIEIAGVNNERIFSFSRSFILKMILTIFAGAAFSALFAISGIGLAIWGIVKKATESKKLKHQ